jgi:hypothetical protein
MGQRRLIAHNEFRLLALAVLAFTLALTTVRASAAVTISSFAAQAQTTTILVKWATASELNNAGFNLYRSTSPNGPPTKVNSNLIPSNDPGGILGSSYSLTDSGVTKGQTYYYKLESVEFSGSKQQFGPVNAAIAAPTATPTNPPIATPTRTADTQATATDTPVPATASPASTTAPNPTSADPTNPPTLVAQYIGPDAVKPTSNGAAPRAQPTLAAVASAPTSVPNIVNEKPASIVADPSEAAEPEVESAPPNRPNDFARVALLGASILSGLFAAIAIGLGAAALYFFARPHIH